MTKESDDRAAALAEASIAAGVTLGTSGIGGAVFAGLLAFTPYVVGRVIPGFLQRKEREAHEWWTRVVMDNGPDKGAGIEIAARSEDPATQEVIVAAFKVILDEVSPSVIPAVAMLTREYARQGKPRDDFFRGTAQVLTDLSADEYADLRELTTWVARNGSGSVTVFHVGGPASIGSKPDTREHLSLGRKREEESEITTTEGFPMRHVRRLFRLLKTTGLGTEAAAGYFDALSGPHVLACEASVMKRLASLMV